MQKYQWHFHNAQGAFLETVVSTSAAGAWRKFRETWSGEARIRQGDAVGEPDPGAAYTPLVPLAYGCSTEFTGPTAADVAEQVMRSAILGMVGMRAIAGHRIHGMHLSAAKRDNGGLERVLTVQWQAAKTLPQELRGEENPIEKKRIFLQAGRDDDAGAEWVWEVAGDKLNPRRVSA